MRNYYVKKYFWCNGDKRIYAGGIIFFDNHGIWVLKEMIRNSELYIDPGGKYHYEDCDIFGTIVREFCEETYYSYPLSKQDLEATVLNENIIETKCNTSGSYYLCVLVFREDQFDTEIFHYNRNRALTENPFVPKSFYSSLDFVKIKFEDIKSSFSKFHNRLKSICFNSFLKKYL